MNKEVKTDEATDLRCRLEAAERELRVRRMENEELRRRLERQVEMTEVWRRKA